MKILKQILVGALAVVVAVACDQGIDPITKVEPGEDTAAPSVTLNNPTEDVIIPFTDEETDLDIQFQVTDDIEITSVAVSVDGSEVATYDEFKDYRRFIDSYVSENMPLGEHTVAVKATDGSGKETTKEFTFEVSNKYVAKYDGEVFYMPFEAEVYLDLLSEKSATVVGEPTFAAGKVGQAYKGAQGAYLTFPTEGLLGSEFSAVFWYNLNAAPDRAGILVIGQA